MDHMIRDRFLARVGFDLGGKFLQAFFIIFFRSLSDGKEGESSTGHHVITRKKKPKRRSTGVVQLEVNLPILFALPHILFTCSLPAIAVFFPTISQSPASFS